MVLECSTERQRGAAQDSPNTFVILSEVEGGRKLPSKAQELAWHTKEKSN